MPNEKEVKEGTAAPLCSVTGRRCTCGGDGVCMSRLGDGRLDALPDEVIRWAKAALVHCSAADADLDLALSACHRQRQAPELREAQRLIAASQKLILERL